MKHEIDTMIVASKKSLRKNFKLLRVHSGCLGIDRRWKTWYNCDKPRGVVKQTLIRGFLNEETQSIRITPKGERTQGSETSQYLKEKKSIEIPPVAVSEKGTAQT